MQTVDSAPAKAPQIAVVGPGDAADREKQLACGVGRLLAQRGAVVVTGGLGGVMEAACQGVSLVDGVSIGLLPGTDRGAANKFVSVPVATGLGEGRNVLVVHNADVVVAVGCGPGTLSEIALAAGQGKPVVLLASYPPDLVPGCLSATTPKEAADLAFEALDPNG